MRGNVSTRLAKLDEHRDGVDVLILAVAGLHRLNQAHRIDEVLNLDIMAPPVGAGVIVAQARANDAYTRDLLAALNDPVTAAIAAAERAMLAELHGHCNSPITGHATLVDDELRLRAAVYAHDGSRWIETTTTGSVMDAEHVGVVAAQGLVAQGARELIDATPQ
jgi:hydroxymethylbilane synthase